MTEVQASSGVQHESPIELTNDQWSQKAMEILGQLWDDRSLADLEVHAQDGAVVQAHSCVLAAASSTLHSLISQMDLSNRAVSLPLTPGHLVESILKYIYSGKITCSGGDLESLVKMADYLCLPDLSRLLSDLVEKLPPKNVQEEDLFDGRIEIKAEDTSCSFEDSVSDGEAAGVDDWVEHQPKNKEIASAKKGENPEKRANPVRKSLRRKGKSKKERPKLECHFCGRLMCSKTTLNEHLRTHTGERPYKCDQCGETFVSKRRLKDHSAVHTGLLDCTICNKTYRSLSNFREHQRQVHSNRAKPVCQFCGKTVGHSSLREHEVRCQGIKPFQCPECPARFAAKYALTVHRVTHTDQFQHQCRICAKRFSRSDNLRTHERIHTGERPFACHVCDQRFRVRCSLKAHKASAHGLTSSIKSEPRGKRIRRKNPDQQQVVPPHALPAVEPVKAM